MLKLVFKGLSTQKILEKGILYGTSRAPIILSELYEQFVRHKEDHDVYIVSASVDIWLLSFAKRECVKLICTQWDFSKSCFKTPNCNYAEKKNRIISEIDLDNYDSILVFGDSAGDKAMYSLQRN